MKPQNEALHAPKKPSQDAELASSATPAPSPLLAPPKPAPLASTNTPKRMTLPPIPISSFLLPLAVAGNALTDNSLPASSDSGVKVGFIVRMRLLCPDKDEGDPTVQKVSNDSLSINGHNFTFDFVADTAATQAGFLFLVMVTVLDVILSWKAQWSMSLYVKLRYVLKVVSATAWVIVLSVTYAYTWDNPPGFAQTIKSWFGSGGSSAPSLYILAVVVYLSPNMLAAIFFLIPFIRRHLERSNYRVVMLMLWWSQIKPLVGPTKAIMNVKITTFQWHEFFPHGILHGYPNLVCHILNIIWWYIWCLPSAWGG
ncbi:callose synthase [Vigna unguiculata]|uniref:Callose synthase n=1 Tax=Vigna unguiculata TaxID=3917 RepID=A0A4D6NT68_VIGUN|nr:callose synthase [Vigna unguiculata]